MITGFRVQNFKAFKDTERINLKPLVLLSGINSAGKSSILQALLLLKQTLESGPGMVLNPGEPLLLGSPVNFLFGFTDGKGNDLPLVYDLIFSYIASRDKPETLAPIHNYDNNELLNSLQVALPEVSLVSNGDELICHLQLTFAWGTFGYLKQRTIRVDNLKISLEIDTTPLLSLDINPRGFSGSYRLTLIKEGTIPELQNLEIEQLEVDSFDHFLPESFSISYPEGTDPLRRDISSRLSQFLRQLFDNIQNDLSEKTYYLSSFRKPPIRFYGYSSTTDSLDPQGGNFPQVWWQHRDKPVYFVHPDFPYPDKKRRYEMRLDEAVAWVQREILGLKQQVTVQPIEQRQDILDVRVETLGEKPKQITLADVGLGYNQILPVIVQGLLTPPGGLIIFEQPEIHLHPDVQAKLIQFFVGLAKSGRRVLVETHSSHIIEHLCLEIAQDDTNWLAENAQTLFVHAPDSTHEGAHIEEIKITSYGEILNWPPSFLPDVTILDEKILKAGFEKRQKEQDASE